MYVDGILVCEIGDFVETFIVYLASFYSFDTSYPKGLHKSLYLMDMVILKVRVSEIKANKSLEKKVFSLISELHAKKASQP